MEKVKCSTPDFAEETAKKLLALLPECAGEGGTVDIEKLKQCLSSKVIEGNVERYEFTWPGKRAAKAAASAATTKTLRPCREESVNFDTTQNLYIEGDNLEVLKLLQTSYANQVKMIYIDPPYNTGHDFVYRDRFSLTQKEIEDEAGAFDEDGNRFEVNDSAEARYHSNWCSMMYPRLKLARNLLRDDGVIFISIDDNEVTNLRKLCDEVFGEKNYLANFLWKKKGTTSNVEGAEVSSLTDATLCYRKSDAAHLHPRVKSKDTRVYPLHDEEGDYRLTIIEKKDSGDYKRDSMKFSIIGHTPREGKRWQIGIEKAQELEAKRRFVFDGEKVQLKIYDFEDKDTTSAWPNLFDDCGSSDSASQMLNQSLLGAAGIFDTPKPIELLGRLARISTDRDSLILDFFSGSATTAHAVMQLNSEDGGNRKFIMVQLEEPCDEGSEAEKAGYKNICEIGKERIRRAGKKIAEENATTAPNLDIGFRVLKLDSSSLNDTSATVSETTQEFKNFDRIKSDRKPEDLLFQMLLETHIPLSDTIVKAKVGGNDVFFVGVDADAKDAGMMSGAPLVACLDPTAKMTTEFFIEIAKLKPGIAFFRDDAFVDDSARTNIQQAFDQFSPTTSITVI